VMTRVAMAAILARAPPAVRTRPAYLNQIR
jgi:hypothetical protein